MAQIRTTVPVRIKNIVVGGKADVLPLAVHISNVMTFTPKTIYAYQNEMLAHVEIADQILAQALSRPLNDRRRGIELTTAKSHYDYSKKSYNRFLCHVSTRKPPLDTTERGEAALCSLYINSMLGSAETNILILEGIAKESGPTSIATARHFNRVGDALQKVTQLAQWPEMTNGQRAQMYMLRARLSHLTARVVLSASSERLKLQENQSRYVELLLSTALADPTNILVSAAKDCEWAMLASMAEAVKYGCMSLYEQLEKHITADHHHLGQIDLPVLSVSLGPERDAWVGDPALIDLWGGLDVLVQAQMVGHDLRVFGEEEMNEVVERFGLQEVVGEDPGGIVRLLRMVE